MVSTVSDWFLIHRDDENGGNDGNRSALAENGFWQQRVLSNHKPPQGFHDFRACTSVYFISRQKAIWKKSIFPSYRSRFREQVCLYLNTLINF